MEWLQSHLPELAMSAAMAWGKEARDAAQLREGPRVAGIVRALTQRPQA